MATKSKNTTVKKPVIQDEVLKARFENLTFKEHFVAFREAQVEQREDEVERKIQKHRKESWRHIFMQLGILILTVGIHIMAKEEPSRPQTFRGR